MNVPTGIGAEEFAAYCYARADPAELQATYDRTFEKFSRYPGGVNSSVPYQPRISPSNATSDRGDTEIGLPSPSVSDSGEPVSQQTPPAATINGPGEGQAAEKFGISAGQDDLSLLTHDFNSHKPKSNGSVLMKAEESSLLVNTRLARSKDCPSLSFMQLDNTRKRAAIAGSTVTTTSAHGKNVPSIHGLLLVRAGDQGLTKTALSKLAGEKKRKRDDDEPLRKRGRTDSYSDVSSGTLSTTRVIHPTMTPRIQRWVDERQDRRGLHQKPSRATKSEISRPMTYTPANDVDPVGINQTWSTSPLQAASNLQEPTAPPVEFPITEQSGTVKKPRALRQNIKIPSRVYRQKVETLLDAHSAITKYCRGLRLKSKVSDVAKLLLHEVFHHEYFEDLPVHAIIGACVIRAFQGRQDIAYTSVFSPELPRHICGRALLALASFFETEDKTKLSKPKYWLEKST